MLSDKNSLSIDKNKPMNEKIEAAKLEMEQGWKLREALKFDESEELLNKAAAAFLEESDWSNYTEALNHLAYLYKLKGLQIALKGMDVAQKSLTTAKEHNGKIVLPLRAALSVTSFAGNFELALKYCEQAIALFEKPMPKADMLSHKATFLLRTGKIEDAWNIILEAEDLCNKHWEEEREPHRSIWLTKILLVKALILYNKGSVTEAKEIALKAQSLAQEKDLKTRLDESKSFLQLFED